MKSTGRGAWVLLAVALPAAAWAVQPQGTRSLSELQSMAGQGRAMDAGSAESAADGAGKGFESRTGITYAGYAPIDEAEGAVLKPTAPGDLVVGKPQRLREPSNPLDEKGKAKESHHGFFGKLLWAGALAAIGGLIGFLFGGPVGLAIGAGIGAVAGYFLAP